MGVVALSMKWAQHKTSGTGEIPRVLVSISCGVTPGLGIGTIGIGGMRTGQDTIIREGIQVGAMVGDPHISEVGHMDVMAGGNVLIVADGDEVLFPGCVPMPWEGVCAVEDGGLRRFSEKSKMGIIK